MSIGAIGEIAYDRISDRSKGFLSSAYTCLTEISLALEEAATQHKEGTRLTVRLPIPMCVDRRLAAQIRTPWKNHTELSCEAMIPVGRYGLGAIAYYGANLPCRRTPSRSRTDEWRRLEHTCREKSSARRHASGYRVEMLDHATNADTGRLAEIYAASFRSYVGDLSAESITAMAQTNTVAVARSHDDTITAVAQAETALFEVNGYPWRLIELSETATDPGHRGQGLSQLCKRALIEALNGPDAIFYAESNARHFPVLKSNHNLGFRPVGRLEQHCLMDSDDESSAQKETYANLFVFSLRVQG